MNPLRRASLAAAAAAILLASVPAAQAQAQAYPNRPIRIIVGFAPGGATDIIARWLGEIITKGTGQPVVVESKSGAGGNLASAAVATAPADGYTLLMATSAHVSNRGLYSNLSYDPVKDFVGVSLVAKVPFLLVAHPSFPGASVADVVKMSKEKPGKLDYSTSGVGSSNHLSGEHFAREAGFNWTHIAYRSGAQAALAVTSGEVPLSLLSTSQALPMVQKGQVKALGVTSAQRVPQLPNVPTFADAGGVPGYETGTWFGLLAPAGTSPAVVARLSAELRKGLQSAEIKHKFDGQGATVVNSTPAEFDKVIQEEDARWFPLVQKLGIKSD